MPRQDVPYGGAICSLKERIAELFDLVGEKLHSINGVQGDGRGDLKLISGDPAVVITDDQLQHEIEISLDTSQLPVAVSSVNGETGAVALDAGDIPSDGGSDVQADIDAGKAAIIAERDARQNADAALQGNINSVQASISDVQADIDAEASTRASAVSAEASARQKADSALQASIDAEASARQTADSTLQASIDALGTAAHKDTGASSGQVPILGAGGKLPNSVIPDLAISAYLGEAEDYAHLTALHGQQGDYAVVKGNSATSGTYIISTGTGSKASDWVRLSGPGDLSGGPGITVSGSVISLSASGVTPGTRGSAVQVPVITADQYGRVTALGGAVIYPPTTPGTSGQVWRSDGSSAGAWETPDTAPAANSAHLVLSKGVKAAIDAEASARVAADSALQVNIGRKLHSINGVQGDGQGNVKLISGDPAVVITGDAAQNEIEIALDNSKLPSGGAVSSVNGKTGAVILNARDIPSDGSSNVQADIDAALPAATPQVYIATIPQTDYLDVFLAQYVRIGPDKGLLSFSGHTRDISLPDDAWILISIDTIMSAMGLTHKRPTDHRSTGWWYYYDGDSYGGNYGSGTVCQVSPEGGLKLGQVDSGANIEVLSMSDLEPNRYISVKDVYVETE